MRPYCIGFCLRACLILFPDVHRPCFPCLRLRQCGDSQTIKTAAPFTSTRSVRMATALSQWSTPTTSKSKQPPVGDLERQLPVVAELLACLFSWLLQRPSACLFPLFPFLAPGLSCSAAWSLGHPRASLESGSAAGRSW